MRSALFTFIATLLFTGSSHATVISTRTVRYPLQNPEDLNFRCEPGVTPNGHNYPTFSDIELSNLNIVIGSTHVSAIGAFDTKQRVGDLCRELTQEFSSALPAYLELKQTVTETVGWHTGICVRSYTETLEGTVGPYRLIGSASFILGEIPGGCSSPG